MTSKEIKGTEPVRAGLFNPDQDPDAPSPDVSQLPSGLRTSDVRLGSVHPAARSQCFRVVSETEPFPSETGASARDSTGAGSVFGPGTHALVHGGGVGGGFGSRAGRAAPDVRWICEEERDAAERSQAPPPPANHGAARALSRALIGPRARRSARSLKTEITQIH